MSHFNKSFFKQTVSLLKKDHRLDIKLSRLINAGFEEKNGSFFLKSLYKLSKSVDELDFIDKTGYECFVNSFHIDDYVQSNYLIQAILFTDKLFNKWKKNNDTNKIEVIISETEYGVNLKFHVIRAQENWINDNDLYQFNEGILICRL